MAEMVRIMAYKDKDRQREAVPKGITNEPKGVIPKDGRPVIPFSNRNLPKPTRKSGR